MTSPSPEAVRQPGGGWERHLTRDSGRPGHTLPTAPHIAARPLARTSTFHLGPSCGGRPLWCRGSPALSTFLAEVRPGRTLGTEPLATSLPGASGVQHCPLHTNGPSLYRGREGAGQRAASQQPPPSSAGPRAGARGPLGTREVTGTTGSEEMGSQQESPAWGPCLALLSSPGFRPGLLGRTGRPR